MLKNTIRLFLIQKDGTQVYETYPPQDDGSIFLQQYKQKITQNDHNTKKSC